VTDMESFVIQIELLTHMKIEVFDCKGTDTPPQVEGGGAGIGWVPGLDTEVEGEGKAALVAGADDGFEADGLIVEAEIGVEVGGEVDVEGTIEGGAGVEVEGEQVGGGGSEPHRRQSVGIISAKEH
jgi:hypothetical protein